MLLLRPPSQITVQVGVYFEMLQFRRGAIDYWYQTPDKIEASFQVDTREVIVMSQSPLPDPKDVIRGVY